MMHCWLMGIKFVIHNNTEGVLITPLYSKDQKGYTYQHERSECSYPSKAFFAADDNGQKKPGRQLS